LTGVLFAALVAAALFANSSYTPKPSASAAKVVSFYAQHQSAIETSAILFALAYAVLVLFTGVSSTYLRRTDKTMGALVLAGGILIAIGGLGCVAIEYSLAHNLRNLSPEAAKTLNLISAELFLPARAGVFVFGLGAGIAILRGVGLPKILGWAGIALAIVMLIHIGWVAMPIAHLGFYAVFAFVGWCAVAGIVMYRRP
jgi:vacuolar-type H+-ATPase subunit I/STV1